jgi:hypothetical protein
MIYKKVSGKYVRADLRADFPNTSFPATMSRAPLPDGYVWVAPSPQPFTGPFESCEEIQPFQDSKGAWRQAWTTRPWSENERAAWRETTSCGPLQMRKALRQTGDYAAVTAAMAQADEETQEAWEYASEVRRTDPMIEAMRLVLGKTAEEVDNLFLLAQSL